MRSEGNVYQYFFDRLTCILYHTPTAGILQTIEGE